MSEIPKIVGIFPYLDELLGAIEHLREQNLQIDTVYSPTHRHEIAEALGMGSLSRVRYYTLAGGVLGILTGVALSVYTSLEWEFIVSGKPAIPVVTTVIVAFELCILMAILFNLLGMLIKSRLPALKLPQEYDPRFSADRFGVAVLCSEKQRDMARRILQDAGAEEVHEVNG